MPLLLLLQDTRIDIGSSLVNTTRGALAGATPSTRGGTQADDTVNKETFLASSQSTLDLFEDLFGEDLERGPVRTFFSNLSALGEPVGKAVKIACEPDGRQYGPCIFRVHYENWAYAPHVNHVRLGDRLFNFEASRFVHQFAGLICLQNAEPAEEYGGHSPGATIYRAFPSPELEAAQQQGELRQYANGAGIAYTTLDIQVREVEFTVHCAIRAI